MYSRIVPYMHFLYKHLVIYFFNSPFTRSAFITGWHLFSHVESTCTCNDTHFLFIRAGHTYHSQILHGLTQKCLAAASFELFGHLNSLQLDCSIACFIALGWHSVGVPDGQAEAAGSHDIFWCALVQALHEYRKVGCFCCTKFLF